MTQRGTQIAALEAEVARLAGAANERAALKDAADETDWLRGLQARIHRDIQTLIGLLSIDNRRQRAGATSMRPETGAPVTAQSWGLTRERLADRLQLEGGPGQIQTSGELALTRIQGIVAQLVAELSPPAEN